MSSIPDASPEDHPALREALKHCSPATYYAACKFWKTRQGEDLRTLVYGVFERFVDRELRPKLAPAGDTLRLREDLGIDSLTMMEVVMIAEEALQISVANDELTRLHTLGEVQAFLLAKVQVPARESGVNGTPVLNPRALPCVGEDVQRR